MRTPRILRLAGGFSLLFVVCVSSVPSPAFCQQTPGTNKYVPPELQGSDPEIRNLLQSVRSSYDAGEYESAFGGAKSALALAERKGLVGDKGLAEAYVAIGYFASGKVEDAIKLYRASLEDAVEASNLVLQADVLVSLSASPQLQGNVAGALELLKRALDVADQSKNVFIKARVLGELGNKQILSGNVEEGRHSVDEALEIDKANGYADIEALHTVYLAYAILAATPATAEPTAAIAKLEGARDLAMQKGNYVALALAENTLAQILVRRGDLSKGVQTLEAARDGKVLKDSKSIDMPAAFRAAVAQPYMKVILLEGLAGAYGAAQEPDKALQAWTELYSLSVASGMTPAQGEAALRIATIYKEKKDAPNALKYFSIASETLRKLQNYPQLAQSLIGEALLLIELGKGEQAIPLERELAEIGRKMHNRQLQFIADGSLAEVYQPQGKLQEAKAVLEEAEKLVTPGPMDSEIDNKWVIEDYTRLGDIYERLNDPVRQMIALEKGFAVASFVKDQNTADNFALKLKQRVESLRLESRIAESYESGRLEDALLCSDILFIYKGAPTPPETGQYWNLVLSLPSQIAARPGGPSALASNLDALGPMLGVGRLPILDALSQHYLCAENKPELARRYALQAVSVLGSSWPTDAIKVWSTCTLAVAYSHTREFNLAHETLGKCLEYSSQVSDPASKLSAHTADVFVHLSLGEPQGARESLVYLRDSAPDNAGVHEQLAAIFLSDGDSEKALSEYDLALHIYEKKGLQSAVANTYRLKAVALESSKSQKDRESAVGDLGRASEIYKDLGDEGGEASAQLTLGEYWARMSDAHKAEDHLELAVKLAQESGHEAIEAMALSDLGNGYLARNKFSEAAEFHQRAVEAYDKAGDSDGQVFALLQLGSDYEQQTKRDEALTAYLKAKSLASSSALDFVKSSVEVRLGWFYFTLGRYGEAETSFREAVRVTGNAGDETNLAGACLSLGVVLATVGDWGGAVEAVDQALRLSQRNKNAVMEYRADAELMNIYSDRASTVRDFDKALKYYSDAVGLRTDSNVALMQLDLLEIYLQRREYDKAVSSAKQGIEACKLNKANNCLANGLISLGEADRRSGDLGAAEAALHRAKPLVDKEADFYLKGRLLYGQAGLERAKGHLRDAVLLYEEVVDMVEAVKATRTRDGQTAVAENYDFIYGELIDTLFGLSQQPSGTNRAKDAEEALRYCESNKARQFQRQWGRTFVAKLRAALPASLQDQESSLLGDQDRLRAELQSSISEWKTASERSPAVIQKELDTLEEKLKGFVASLRNNQPAYAAVAYPEAVSLDSLPLHSGELAVEFKVTDDGTFVWMIEGTTGRPARLLSFYKVPQGHQWIGDRVNDIRSAFNQALPGRYRPESSEELFAALFPPEYAGYLRNHTSITVIPDDVLFLIPFEVLSPSAARGEYELTGTPLRYYPSLGALRIARGAHHRTEWREAFLGVGDPVTSPDDLRYTVVASTSPSEASSAAPGTMASAPIDSDPIAVIKSRGFSFDRLPGTAKEVRDVATLFEARGEGAKILLGPDATKAQITSTDLGQFRFLHFATHGVLPSDGGIREPSLILSLDGTRPQNMLFSVSDILKLQIGADTVVLSACNTGSGKVSRAEGVMSLGRAFMTAGAESVTVSLWQVSDNSTQMFMEEYYKNLLDGKPKAESLALARSYLFSKGYKNPFFWAPFVLIGE